VRANILSLAGWNFNKFDRNYLNLITERFPGLAFLELSPFDKMQFLIGDVNFSLDTNIGLFFDKIGKTMLQQITKKLKILIQGLNYHR
jgi:hypothetical protein